MDLMKIVYEVGRCVQFKGE